MGQGGPSKTLNGFLSSFLLVTAIKDNFVIITHIKSLLIFRANIPSHVLSLSPLTLLDFHINYLLIFCPRDKKLSVVILGHVPLKRWSNLLHTLIFRFVFLLLFLLFPFRLQVMCVCVCVVFVAKQNVIKRIEKEPLSGLFYLFVYITDRWD